MNVHDEFLELVRLIDRNNVQYIHSDRLFRNKYNSSNLSIDLEEIQQTCQEIKRELRKKLPYISHSKEGVYNQYI